MYVLQIWHGQWFGIQYLILDLNTLIDSEDFQGPYFTILLLGLLWIQYQRKLYVNFCLVDGHRF